MEIIKEEIKKWEENKRLCSEMAARWNREAGAAMGKILELRKMCKHDFKKIDGHHACLSECKICGYVGAI